MNIQDIRRARLKLLIRDKFASQADFVQATGENQGEVSALLKSKSFGEKKARKIEAKCNLPAGWLDDPSDVGEGKPDQAHASAPILENGPPWMNPEAYKLITLYFSADADGRAEIMNTAIDQARLHAKRVIHHEA